MTAPDPGLPDRLRAVSAAHLHVPESALVREAALTDDLGIDSLAAIEWAMVLEDELGIVVPEDAWETTTTYGAVEDLVARLVGTA